MLMKPITIVFNPRFRGTATRLYNRDKKTFTMVKYSELHYMNMDDSFYERSFHFAYPEYANPPKRIARARGLFARHKGEQRAILSRFFNTPTIHHKWRGKVVVRGNSHTRGIGFRVYESIDKVPIKEAYVAPLVEREWEARLIYVFGKLVFAYKRFGDRQDRPWNIRFGSRIEFVNDLEGLVQSLGDFQEHMNNFTRIVTPDIMGLDVAKTKSGYSLFEINFAPGTPLVDGVRHEEMVDSIYKAVKERMGLE